MSRVLRADLPAAAHGKAILAMDEFDSIMAEYTVLLATQHALVRDGNIDALTETIARGDGLARTAARCGRRVSALREAMDSDRFAGPRASELKRRFDASNVRVQALEGSVSRMAALCVVERDKAAVAIDASGSKAAPMASAAYGAARANSLILDRRG